MAIPAEASLDVVATLVCPARDDVLHRAGQDVTVVRKAGRKRRSVIERVPEKHTHAADDRHDTQSTQGWSITSHIKQISNH